MRGRVWSGYIAGIINSGAIVALVNGETFAAIGLTCCAAAVLARALAHPTDRG